MIPTQPTLSAQGQHELGITVKGNWGNARIQQEVDAVVSARLTINKLREDHGVNPVPSLDSVEDKFQTLEWANERAAQIWKGQSPNLSIAERVGRIKAGLKDRGFIRFDELVLPTDEDYQRYL